MVSTLHVIHNHEVADLSIQEIFDSELFDTFTGVTYSVSPSFINRYLAGFKKVSLAVGIAEKRIQNGANEAAKNLQAKIEGLLNDEPSKLYQSLTTNVKEKLNDKTVELLIPLGYIIHSKFYLMSHSETKATRLVLGSANLSEQAFNNTSNQFESITIFDNDRMFKHFENYYQDTLLPILSDYIPQELLKINEKRIRSLQENQKELTNEIILLNNKELERIKEKAIVEAIEDTDYKITLGILPVTLKEEMRNLSDNRQEEEREQRIQQGNEVIAFTIVKEAISSRSKEPTIKSTPSLTKTIQQKVKVKLNAVTEDGLPTRPLTINSPEQRNKAKGRTGLFQPSDANKDTLLSIGKLTTNEVISQSLENINELIKTFEKYTVKYETAYGARVMEAIFYCFTAPFMFEIKRKARSEEERNDIPQFLFLGGTAGSGKSSLLKALSKMVNVPAVMDYNSIIPSGGRRKKATIDALEGWLVEENVTPLLIDEVPEEFFTNRQYGNELIVNISNRMAVNPNAFPVMIGTTNADGYTLEERARRRSYYLKLDKVFDELFRQESQPAYNKVYDSLNDNLFLDFLVRMAERLSDENLHWVHFEQGSKIDFLFHTREIFKEYYSIAKLPLPGYFPLMRYDDSKETNQEKWRKLYLGTSMSDFKFDDYTGNLLFKTATLDENISRFGGGKPSEIYKNALSPKVLVGSKDSADIELDTQLFFGWIEVDNPFEVKYKQQVRDYYLQNKIKFKKVHADGTIDINMSEVMNGRQNGAVEQYKHYMPETIVCERKENHLVKLNFKAFCEWIEVPYKSPNLFAKLFSVR